MDVRRVSASEWRELRAIRLAALADAPQAFGSRLDETAARPDEWWVEWAARSEQSEVQIIVLAWEADEPVGIAGSFCKDGVWTVFSMWTDPRCRGRGIAAQLLDVVVAFAGDAEMVLSCTEGNDGARRLYERYGFVATGETEPLESDPSLLIHHMRLVR